VSPETLAQLKAYDWPGNIRELQNVVERAVILCEGETLSIDPTWLACADRNTRSAQPVVDLVEREKAMIEAAFASARAPPRARRVPRPSSGFQGRPSSPRSRSSALTATVSEPRFARRRSDPSLLRNRAGSRSFSKRRNHGQRSTDWALQIRAVGSGMVVKAKQGR